MTTLILGAGGFLGSLLTNALINRGDPVETVSRSFQWKQFSGENRYCSLITDTDSYHGAIERAGTIVYMAGATNIPNAERYPVSDILFHYNQLSGLFECMRKCNLAADRVVLISSAGTVYGDSKGVPMNENSPRMPKSVYGLRNLLHEDFFLSESKALPVRSMVLRVSNPFGPGQISFARAGLVSSLIRSSFSGEEILVRGDGLQLRDYIYSLDLARLLLAILDLPAFDGVLNVASSCSYSARQVVDILRSFGLNPTVSYQSSQPEYEVVDSIICNAKLCSLLDCDVAFLEPFRRENMVELLNSW